EAELLGYAATMTANELERLVRSWRRAGRESDEERAERIHQARTLSVFPDDDGAYVVRGRVAPEVGALLMRAIELASARMYAGSVPGSTPEQRRADALALLVELGMGSVSAEASGRRESERVSAEAGGRAETGAVSAE